MKLLNVILIIALSFVFGCATSLSVESSFSDPEAKRALAKNKTLIIAKTNDYSARVELENKIKLYLEENGYSSTASYTRMPTLQPNKKVDEERMQEIYEAIKREGFETVILTTLKHVDSETKTTTTGGYYAGGSYYNPYYGGFGSYFSNVYSYYQPGIYVPGDSTTREVKNYELETVVYHLEVDNGKLVSVVTAKINDPSSLAKAADAYAKTIVEEILK